jgi:dihydroorotate dehydrogenase (NAD+) catalytic subunit
LICTRLWRTVGCKPSLVDLRVTIGSLTLKNPVMPASGTFGLEHGKIIDFARLGACVTKSVTPKLRAGNPTPRVCETSSGMLNSIGIPSKGLRHFCEQVVPAFSACGTPLVASVSADTVEEFAQACAELSVPGVAAIEANISCPNLEADGRAFAMSARDTVAAITAMRARTALPLWAKLTPNTGDIAAIARAAEAAGAEAVVVANTILGMAIDVNTRRPKLGNVMGGLSGPAVKPIILRMVYQCARAVKIPIIGCGGIMTAEDAVEYLLAGAAALQVGTATFLHPRAMIDVIEGLERYCAAHSISRVAELTSAVVVDEQLSERTLRHAIQV